jgi:hypothetical protein
VLCLDGWLTLESAISSNDSATANRKKQLLVLSSRAIAECGTAKPKEIVSLVDSRVGQLVSRKTIRWNRKP